MNHDETIEYYQMRAGEYDKIFDWRDPGRQSELTILYDQAQDAMSGRKVLDAACGTGYLTRVVSEKASSITGIDINPGTLLEAEKKEYRCPVRFIRADAFDLPFADQEFDGLLMTFLISHIRRQDIEQLARQVRQILKPGSTAFLCDNNLTPDIKSDLVWDNDRINSYKKRRLENGREFNILKNYFEKEELVEIFGSWGRVENLSYNTYYWWAVLTL